MTTTITSRQFNQDASSAKRATKDGPVMITDRGRPSHVLLSIEEYQRLKKRQITVREALAQGDQGDFDFEPARLSDRTTTPADLD